MEASTTWRTVRKVGQWCGAIFGLAKAVVWTREMLTRPDRDVLVETLGSVVSLHSLYLGAAVGGLMFAFGCAWPVVGWANGIRKRWARERESQTPSNRLRQLKGVVMSEFKKIEHDYKYRSIGRTRAAKIAEREMLSFELFKVGVETPNPTTQNDEIWYEFITALVPLTQHGRSDEAVELGASFAGRT